MMFECRVLKDTFNLKRPITFSPTSHWKDSDRATEMYRDDNHPRTSIGSVYRNMGETRENMRGICFKNKKIKHLSVTFCMAAAAATVVVVCRS